jgi:tetratricopeptide (TPR) repeat protein
MEFCPVCMLHKALAGGAASGESSFQEAVKPTPETPVERFEHYELVTGDDGKPVELGRGAMGVTYKAFDADLRCPVTLKVISERYLGDESARLRFLREARAAASVRHPNVASVFHLGRTGRSYFYAMEFVEGETLEHLIRRSGRVETKLALEIITQVTAGLAAVHEQGLVHRDIKPANIMVRLKDDGSITAKIIDLGLAKTLDESASEAGISSPGAFVGTPEFASPEQFGGVGVDIRSDLYSLGVTLWVMVTDQTPFRGTSAEVMYQHLHAPLPLERLKDVPQPVVVLLEKLLEKNPVQRFRTPVELLEAITTITGAIYARRRITRQSLQKTPSTALRVRTRTPPGRLAPKKISIARLPVTGSAVFGRDEDVAFLNDAWANPHVNVVTIVAWAGVGKSTLVNHWLGQMAADRPADEQALGALLKPPAIPGLTESLADLSPTAWRTILARLRRARLLAGEDPHNPEQLDTHPLVREYFGEQLRTEQTDAWKECNRRLFTYYRTLAPQLPDSFREMEPLFSAVVCGCNAGLYREALHEVYIPRIQRGNAYFAGKVLGATGPLLSVLVHFFEHGHWGSLVDKTLEGQSLTAEDQLLILMQAGLYLTATRGLAAPEARICHERAEPLCESLNEPRLLCMVLRGQFRYALNAEKLSRALHIVERFRSLAQEQNDAALMLGAYSALSVTLLSLGDFESARQYASRGVQIWRLGNVPSYAEDFHSPVVGCLCYGAMSEWHLGEIASCHAAMAEAISLAKKLNDMNALAIALGQAMNLAATERNLTEVARFASDLIELSTRHNFASWLAVGAIWRGWALSASGDTTQGIAWIEQGIRDFRATGAVLPLPFYLMLKAESLYLAERTSEALEAINEAEALAERFEHRGVFSRLHWLRGVFLTAMDADAMQIEASFSAAIRIAREQKSISLEKRAEGTYAGYRRQKAIASGGRGFRLPLW